AQNGLDGRVLALEHARRALEDQRARIDTRRLHDRALLGNVPMEDGEAAIPAEGVFDVADDTRGAIEIERLIPPLLAEGFRGADAPGCRSVEGLHLPIPALADVPFVERGAERSCVHDRHL